MEYIADSTHCIVARTSSAKAAVRKIDVHDKDLTRTHATHFGTYFKENNAKVAIMLKNLLVNTPTYSNVTNSITNKNGNQTIISVRDYYERDFF